MPEPESSGPPSEGRRSSSGRRPKSIVLITGILVSGLIIVSWTQDWFTVRLVADELDGEVLAVGGDVAAGGLAGLGLAGLALAGALSIAGRVIRIVLGVLQVLIGAVVTLSSVVALANPLAAVQAAVSDATGIGGTGSVAELVADISTGFWPIAAAVLGIASVVLGVIIVATSRSWPESRRHEAVRFEPDDDGSTPDDLPASSPAQADAVADWDALSDGSDPTSR